MVDRLLLLVEGKDDLHVIKAIMAHHDFSPDFDIKDEGGIDNLLARLPVRLKPGTDLERLGIVVDADLEIANRWAAIRNILSKAGYNTVPANPDPSGTIIEQDELPRIGVWVMPDNKLPGMMEDFVTLLIPEEKNALLDQARHCVDEIPSELLLCPNRSKVLIHTWLAWQAIPGTSLGLAITKRYFNADGPHVTSLVSWLSRLFA